MRESRLLNRILGSAAACATLLLTACAPKVVQSVALAPGQTPTVGAPVVLEVKGTGGGNCPIDVDWGEGGPVFNLSVTLTDPAKRTISHSWSGWGGGKTVTVTGTGSCTGTVRARFDMAPTVFKVGFAQPGPRTCNTVAGMASVMRGNLVHITTIPSARWPNGINFGCPFGGCYYDADGKPGTAAGANFPFAGMREYSLVLRFNTSLVQGGTNVQFRAPASAFVEFCLNDFNMADNGGGYEIDVRVDQLGPP